MNELYKMLITQNKFGTYLSKFKKNGVLVFTPGLPMVWLGEQM